MKFKIIPFLVRQKVYIDTANVHASYLRYPTMAALVLGVFHVHVTPLMIILGVPGLVFVFRTYGWLIRKIGFFQAEAARHSALNPYNQELMDRVKNIEKKLEEKQ